MTVYLWICVALSVLTLVFWVWYIVDDSWGMRHPGMSKPYVNLVDEVMLIRQCGLVIFSRLTVAAWVVFVVLAFIFWNSASIEFVKMCFMMVFLTPLGLLVGVMSAIVGCIVMILYEEYDMARTKAEGAYHSVKVGDIYRSDIWNNYFDLAKPFMKFIIASIVLAVAWTVFNVVYVIANWPKEV